jgi:hypothetical protein
VSLLRNLIPDYVAPERLYLETRWASLVPYAAAAGPAAPSVVRSARRASRRSPHAK